MADSADATVPTLCLLRSLQPPTSGPTRSWQSAAHPDPSTPLLATASADKTVNVWSLRDFSLISTISGGHKRSVRAVDWKDFGRPATGSRAEKKPVVLGTGSFDANVGVWVWNDDRRWARFKDVDTDAGAKQGVDAQGQGQGEGRGVRPAGEDSAMAEDLATDLTNDDQDQDEEDEEWHFSTLLTGPDSEIKSIAFSPPHYPANWLATSSRDKSVWVWEEVEPEEWETIAVLSEHTGDVKCVSWCAGARRGNGRSRTAKRRKLVNGVPEDGDVEMAEESPANGAAGHSSSNESDEAVEDRIIGSRDILASGSYDDTIRLWRDVEEEGDWICVGVIDQHKGTVWDVKWETHINYAALDFSQSQASDQEKEKATEEFENDWEPRLLSCSDDLTVRIFRRELSDAEKAKKQQNRSHASLDSSAPMGFASSRLPSVIRPMSSTEQWTEEAVLPQVHVRSVYAVDWSRNSGLVVSCGGDGTIAVYKEIPTTITAGQEDVVMNGTTPHPSTKPAADQDEPPAADLPYTVSKTEWKLVAMLESAHDEYEVNHVCWAVRRDKDRRFDGEEVIVSTGDEGEVRVWSLPGDILAST